MATPPLNIRQLRHTDLPVIADLLAASPEASQWMPGDAPGHLSLVAEVSNGIAGFAIARTVAPGEFELLNLAVTLKFRRRGVAEELIRQLFLFSPGDWFLEVRETNSSAIQLYEKIGFSRIGTRASYYADSKEDAIVMRFRAC
ncbi:MAG: GNAT family N-acetyltransferase [Bryobacterales bacterium]|nr:GNAT family N-acetyltransferase [Bryobacterales bacterium]